MKFANRILLSLLSLLLTFSLAACQEAQQQPLGQEAESAAVLWEKIDQTMNALESMEITSTTQFAYYVSGNRYNRSVKRYLLSAKDAHYTRSEDTTTCPEMEYEQSFTTMEAYFEGKVYTAVNTGVYEQKFCTEMTHEEYDHAPSGDLTEEFQIAVCEQSTCCKDENGLWNLHFSGYDKAAIDSVLTSLGLMDALLSETILDMEVSITAGDDYYVHKMQIKLIFAEGEHTPEFSVTAEYTGLNSTTFDTAQLNPQEYVMVEDLRILTALTDALKQRQNADSGRFTMDMTNTYIIGKDVTVSIENNQIDYARQDGWYTYTVVSNSDGVSYRIHYQNGMRTVTAGKDGYVTEQTDEQAKSFIDGLIDSARYNSAAVTDIQKREDGSYVLTCGKLDVREYTEGYDAQQLQLTEATQEIVVSFEEGLLSSVQSLITIRGDYDGESITMITETQVAFIKPTEEA